MRGFRFLCFGLALAGAVALIASTSPGIAKDYGGIRVSTAVNYHDFSIPDLSMYFAPPADQVDRLSTGDNATLIKPISMKPRASGAAVLATTQAGWRSGRLRRLSVG